MILKPDSKIVFIGDSITDAGRDKPGTGEGLFGAYGNGYVSLVNAMLFTLEPAKRYRVVNKGVSGNTIRDLKARWQADVLGAAPDYLSIMIGINDVWRQFDMPLVIEAGVPVEEYRDTLGELIEKTLPTIQGLILCTPYYIEANRDDAMRKTMDGYADAVRDAAKQHDAILVDTQAAFDRHLEHYHPNQLAWDRVHPNLTGHFILAKAWLDAVGRPIG